MAPAKDGFGRFEGAAVPLTNRNSPHNHEWLIALRAREGTAWREGVNWRAHTPYLGELLRLNRVSGDGETYVVQGHATKMWGELNEHSIRAKEY